MDAMISRNIKKTTESVSNIVSSTKRDSNAMDGKVESEDMIVANKTTSSNDKLEALEREIVEPSSKDKLTSDFGVKNPTHDIWLSASTSTRQGPQLLEDGFAREKV